MRHPVRTDQRGDIAVIQIECPPVETLSVGVRRSIAANLDAALADDATRIIVIAGQQRGLPQSSDLREVGQKDQTPSLADLCLKIEAASKPVIAALQGPALNAGLELAMAAHYRVASHKSIFGLTDIRLGLPPGAGGSQRLPRLVGADAALAMMLAGKPIAGGDAVKLGLVDALSDKDICEAALYFGKEDLPVRPTSAIRKHLIDTTAYLAATQKHTAKVAENYFHSTAANAILKNVESAVLMPIEAGLAVEARAYRDCYNSTESRGLRHAAFAERVAGLLPELQESEPGEISSIGIVGGGAVGARLATLCMDCGLSVTLLERNKAASKAALHRIASYYRTAITQGRISESEGATALKHINLVQSADDLAHCDVIIEALPDEKSLKARVLKHIGRAAQETAVIATTSQRFDIDVLATLSKRPNRVIGLHVFEPAERLKLAELVVGGRSSNDAVATAHRFLRGIKRVPVRSGITPGFIVERMLNRFRLAAEMALLEGAKPSQVDAAMRLFGFELGPFQTLDDQGLDPARLSLARLKPGPGQIQSQLLKRMCQIGFTGKTARMGFYTYKDKTQRGRPNRDVISLVEQDRAARGIVTKKLRQAEISERLHLALMDEASRVLEDGTARRASDIDTAMIHGIGYPRILGGPLFQADELGAFEVVRRIEAINKDAPGYGEPSRLLRSLASERSLFADIGVT